MDPKRIRPNTITNCLVLLLLLILDKLYESRAFKMMQKARLAVGRFCNDVQTKFSNFIERLKTMLLNRRNRVIACLKYLKSSQFRVRLRDFLVWLLEKFILLMLIVMLHQDAFGWRPDNLFEPEQPTNGISASGLMGLKAPEKCF